MLDYLIYSDRFVNATMLGAEAILQALIEAMPYRITTVQTARVWCTNY